MFISTTPTPESAAAFAAYAESQRDHWGFVPDYTGCFAARPEVATAWIALASADVVTAHMAADRAVRTLQTVAQRIEEYADAA